MSQEVLAFRQRLVQIARSGCERKMAVNTNGHVEINGTPPENIMAGILRDYARVTVTAAPEEDAPKIPTEEPLIKVNGEKLPVSQIYEEFRPRVFRFIRGKLNGGDPEVAKDLAADVFVKVLEKADKYEDRGKPFEAWLYTVAHNRTVDHFRTPKNNNNRTVSIDNFERDSIADQRAERELEEPLIRADLEQGMRHLTPGQREVIKLRFLRGQSIAETAMTIDRSEAAVKKLQARGLNVLKHVLEKRCDPKEKSQPCRICTKVI